MGERDTARREAEDARARLSVLASELGRRATPEYAKEHARELMAEKKTEWKEHARELIAEKKAALKDNAKERMMRTTSDWRMVAEKNPRGAGTLGALVGAGLGAFLAKKLVQREETRFERTEYWDGRGEVGGVGYATAGAQTVERGVVPAPAVSYRGEEFAGYGTEGIRAERYGEGEAEGRSVKEKAREAISSAKEKASEAISSAKERTSHGMEAGRGRAEEAVGRVREHIPSRDQLREQAFHARDVARRTASDRPMMVGLGAIAFGFIAASLLPVTNKERRALAPAKERTRETLSQLGEKAEAKLAGNEEGEQSSQAFRGSESNIGGYGAGSESNLGAVSPSSEFNAGTGFNTGTEYRAGELGETKTVIARPEERPSDTGYGASSEFDTSRRSSSDTQDVGNIEPPDYTKH